jgi:hypothetical protein
MISGNDDDPDARPTAAHYGLGDIWAGWIFERRQAEERKVRLGTVAVCVGLCTVDASLGEPEHMQALASVALERLAYIFPVGLG